MKLLQQEKSRVDQTYLKLLLVSFYWLDIYTSRNLTDECNLYYKTLDHPAREELCKVFYKVLSSLFLTMLK